MKEIIKSVIEGNLFFKFWDRFSHWKFMRKAKFENNAYSLNNSLFCSRCTETDKKQIRLHRMGNGDYKCPACGTYAGSCAAGDTG